MGSDDISDVSQMDIHDFYCNLYQKPMFGEGIGSRAERQLLFLPTGHASKLTSKYFGVYS